MQFTYIKICSMAHFRNIVSTAIQIGWKTRFAVCNSIYSLQIATKFCTWHDSTAALPYAKFWRNHIVWNELRAKLIFHTICYAIEKPFMKWAPGKHFKNTHELLNLRALKFSPTNKIYIFQCMGKIFCVEFQRYPLKFHTKYLTHTLKDMIFIQHWNFKSS